jgi:hypothetical protein
MSKEILKNGTEIIVNIPFTYTIGEEGFYTCKVLKTIADCEAEVIAEVNSGVLSDNEILMESNIINK